MKEKKNLVSEVSIVWPWNGLHHEIVSMQGKLLSKANTVEIIIRGK